MKHLELTYQKAAAVLVEAHRIAEENVTDEIVSMFDAEAIAEGCIELAFRRNSEYDPQVVVEAIVRVQSGLPAKPEKGGR